MLFYCNTPGETALGSFQRREYSGTVNLPVASAISLLCAVAQLPSSAFPFLANLRYEGPAFSAQSWGPGTALEVERLQAQQTRARPQITAMPAHPARRRRTGPPPRGGPQRPERSAAAAGSSPLAGPAQSPRISLGPHDPGWPGPASPGTAELGGSLRRWALPDLRAGDWPPAGSRPCHARAGLARAVAAATGAALTHFPGETTVKFYFFCFFLFFFSFPSHIRVLFAKQEKEDTTRQEITALHLSQISKIYSMFLSPS